MSKKQLVDARIELAIWQTIASDLAEALAEYQAAIDEDWSPKRLMKCYREAYKTLNEYRKAKGWEDKP